MALSGRNAVLTLVANGFFESCLWNSKESIGSSVVQTNSALTLLSKLRVLYSGEFIFAEASS